MEKIWVSPDGSFAKRILKKGSGFDGPQEGATCCLQVLKDDLNALQSSEDGSRQLILGEADNVVDSLLELCLRTMKEEEECEFYVLKKALQADTGDEYKSAKKAASNRGSIVSYGSRDGEDSSSKAASRENSLDEGDNKDAATCVLENECLTSPNKNLEIDQKKEEEALDEDDELLNMDKDNASPLTDNPEESLARDKDSEGSNETLKEETSENTGMAITASQADEESGGFIQEDYVITLFCLTAYTREPEIWEMSITEKTRRFNHHKDRGVELYAQKEYRWAFRRFSKAIKYLISLQYEIPKEDQHEQSLDIPSLKMTCYLNLAACQLKRRNYEHAAINCSKALDIEPNNPKALYRRGTAFIHLQEYEKAKDDLDRAFDLEPNRKAIHRQQQILRGRVQKLNQYYAKCMKKMFN